MIQGLDHVNIRVTNLEATLRFYRDVLGMRADPPPGMPVGSPEAWIHDAQGRPVVHAGTVDLGQVTGINHGATASGSGAIHHIAFDCSNYEGAIEHIRHSGVNVRCNDIPAANLRQLFVADPDEILIELNFRGFHPT